MAPRSLEKQKHTSVTSSRLRSCNFPDDRNTPSETGQLEGRASNLVDDLPAEPEQEPTPNALQGARPEMGHFTATPSQLSSGSIQQDERPKPDTRDFCSRLRRNVSQQNKDPDFGQPERDSPGPNPQSQRPWAPECILKRPRPTTSEPETRDNRRQLNGSDSKAGEKDPRTSTKFEGSSPSQSLSIKAPDLYIPPLAIPIPRRNAAPNLSTPGPVTLHSHHEEELSAAAMLVALQTSDGAADFSSIANEQENAVSHVHNPNSQERRGGSESPGLQQDLGQQHNLPLHTGHSSRLPTPLITSQSRQEVLLEMRDIAPLVRAFLDFVEEPPATDPCPEIGEEFVNGALLIKSILGTFVDFLGDSPFLRTWLEEMVEEKMYGDTSLVAETETGGAQSLSPGQLPSPDQNKPKILELLDQAPESSYRVGRRKKAYSYPGNVGEERDEDTILVAEVGGRMRAQLLPLSHKARPDSEIHNTTVVPVSEALDDPRLEGKWERLFKKLTWAHLDATTTIIIGSLPIYRKLPHYVSP